MSRHRSRVRSLSRGQPRRQARESWDRRRKGLARCGDRIEGPVLEDDVVEELGADGYLYGHTDINDRRVDIVARVDGRSHPNAGDKVFILPEPHHVHVYDTESGLRLSKKAVIASK